MGKYSWCIVGICYNNIRYPELHKKHSNVNGDVIMHKSPKDGAVRAAWIKAILKGGKMVIQESLYISVTVSLVGELINPSSVCSKINPSPVRWS